MKKEVRDIVGYEGIYNISTDGVVKSAKTDEIIACRKAKTGYMRVDLYREGVGTTHYVHRLVLSAFRENPDGKPQVNHIDGDKTNNALPNLEWATQAENMHHAISTGLINFEKIKRHGITGVHDGISTSYDSILTASIQTGVCRKSIYRSLASGKAVSGYTFSEVY